MMSSFFTPGELHYMRVGIPYAITLFVFFNALGLMRHRKLTWYVALVSFVGAVVWYVFVNIVSGPR